MPHLNWNCRWAHVSRNYGTRQIRRSDGIPQALLCEVPIQQEQPHVIRGRVAPVRALASCVHVPQRDAGVPGQHQVQEALVAHLVDQGSHGVVVLAAM